jgi:hypothetical protein
MNIYSGSSRISSEMFNGRFDFFANGANQPYPGLSLPVSSRPVSLGLSVRVAHEFPLLRLSVPPRSGIVINTSSRINPDKLALGRLNNKRSGRSWNLLRTENCPSFSTRVVGDPGKGSRTTS